MTASLRGEALDFDDLILHTVRLLQNEAEVRDYYRHKFRYILIDEYQDTNRMQYELVRLLADGHRNICVVGDDDQSIYRFRGADISNILNFEKEYKGTRTIRLEQNYRSTQNILDAANAVIKNNVGRKGKTLWTDAGSGEKVTIKTVFNEQDEANFVVSGMMTDFNRGKNWRDNAVLYRMNAQSNALEYALKRNGIPYQVVGGMKFFDRAEVKDMLAYLALINNPADDLRLRRIINTPARGIGNASVERVQTLAAEQGVPMMTVLRAAGGVRGAQDRRGAAGEIRRHDRRAARRGGRHGACGLLRPRVRAVRLSPRAGGQGRYGEPRAAGERAGAQVQHPRLPRRRAGGRDARGLPQRDRALYRP